MEKECPSEEALFYLPASDGEGEGVSLYLAHPPIYSSMILSHKLSSALDSVGVKGSHALPNSHWIILPLKELSELCLNLTLCQREGLSRRVV